MNKNITWLISLKKNILKFLFELKDNSIDGYYNYSLTGDILPSEKKWGLGNTVFAAKIYYMLDKPSPQISNPMKKFIKSFQDKQGQIYDREVQRCSRLKRYYHAFRKRDFNNIFNEQTRRAETRQAFAALRCLGSRPDIPYLLIPYNEKEIEKYIHKLNWKQPWGAGSHISHLLFFLRQNNQLFHVHQDNTDELIQFVIEQVNTAYRQKDGSWYDSSINIPHFEKVNVAMKMMTAFDAAEWKDFEKENELIDLCLSAINDGHACNQFNVICVLYHCSQKTDYRKEEIKQYCFNQLELYKEYFWPEYGGFSFFKGRANHNYYGAKISKGLPEPDIHGTVLFLWGIALISRILEIENKIMLKIPVT
ncbi:Glycosyl hydrolase family 88 [Candidatus Magnetomoraceae bacterium gMMP-15]